MAFCSLNLGFALTFSFVKSLIITPSFLGILRNYNGDGDGDGNGNGNGHGNENVNKHVRQAFL